MDAEEMETIEVEIDNELLFRVMMLAHESDVTLNKYIEKLLTDYLDELERKSPI